jgi:MOSC domain-containing protein YiiM
MGTALPLVVAGAGTEAVVMSAIRKHPQHPASPYRVGVHRLGMAGDEQVDRTVHGGPDRAVYAYPIEHYTWWNTRRREAGVEEAERPLAFGAMGENLTTQGLLEPHCGWETACDIGDVEFVVKSTRRPCFKPNAALGYAVRCARHDPQCFWVYCVARPGVMYGCDGVVLVPGPRGSVARKLIGGKTPEFSAELFPRYSQAGEPAFLLMF